VAQVVTTSEDIVALVNQQAEVVFGLSNRDIGRPLRDLDVSYRPVELRAYVEQAKVERRGIQFKDGWRSPSTPCPWSTGKRAARRRGPVGLRQDEALARHLLNLDIGLPVADLRSTVLAAPRDVTFEKTMLLSARGRKISPRVHRGPPQTRSGEIRGAILFMNREDSDEA
jgi:hypothetical protein